MLVNNVGMMGPGYNNMADMEKKAVKVKLSDSFFSNIRITDCDLAGKSSQ